jgi:ankyrin repeat protein
MRVSLLQQCEANIEESDYDLRTVGHLAAAEGHWDLLTFLATRTNFNFEIKDRWGKTPLDEIANPETRTQYEIMLRESRANG